jgi:hypothetical protein
MNQFEPLLEQSESSGTTRGSLTQTSLMERVSTRILSWFSVPEGYEDETGFHYGPQPKPTWMTATTSPEARQVFTDRVEAAIIYAAAAAPKPGTGSPDCRPAALQH